MLWEFSWEGMGVCVGNGKGMGVKNPFPQTSTAVDVPSPDDQRSLSAALDGRRKQS